jgi:NTP pyrophosphatase (non-canonical NTP hydrolase)
MTNQQLIQTKKAQDEVEAQVNGLVACCHSLAEEAGWWTCLQSGQSTKFTANIPEKLMLIVSEVAEAMEGHRKGLDDDHCPQFKMLDMELADAVIRIFDLAGALRIPLGKALATKLAYNATRKDHTPEHRAADGGKKF